MAAIDQRSTKRQRNHSGLVCRPGEVQPFRSLGRRGSLRLVAVSGQSRLGVGGRAVHHVLAVRVPPLPAGVQAHRPQHADSRRLQLNDSAAPGRGRVPLPGDLLPGRAPRRTRSRRATTMRRILLVPARRALRRRVTGARGARGGQDPGRDDDPRSQGPDRGGRRRAGRGRRPRPAETRTLTSSRCGRASC